MNIRNFKDLKEALIKTISIDREYAIVLHVLKEGEFIEPHKHSISEYIIFDQGGIVEIEIGDETKTIHCPLLKTTTVFIPGGQKHSLKAFTDITYFVLRGIE